jgi:iron complex transport system substrate-binding protein
MVCALGADHDLVGVSHECDYPPAVTRLARVTVTPIDQSRPGVEIDAEVRALRAAGRPVIGVNPDQLRALAPEIVLTQDLCEVCAVADGEVHRLADSLDRPPRIISLTARDLDGIWHDIRVVGESIGRRENAERLVAALTARLARLGDTQPAARPKVLCVEWLDPLYLAGHWVPQLIEAAGGADVGAVAGFHSVATRWENVADTRPELVIVAICGFGVERAFKELADLADNHWLNSSSCPVWVLDGNAFTSRPGPRVVEGAELMQSALLGIERPGLIRYEKDPQISQIQQE